MSLFNTLNGILGSGLSGLMWIVGADSIDGKRSDDNGNSWTDLPASNTLDRSPFYGTPIGTVMGSGFTPSGIYRSTDNGLNFTHVSGVIAGSDIHSFTGNISGNWVAAGGSSNLAYSNDDGVSWTLSSNPFPLSTVSLNSVTNDKSGNFIAVGDAYNPGAGLVAPIAVSTDNGVNWTDESFSLGLDLEDISTDGTTWIAVGRQGTIYRSTDTGSTWNDISSGVPFGTGASDNIESICNFNGVWIISGNDLTLNPTAIAISRSTDSGTTWSSFITNPITESGGNKVRVGADGTFMVVNRQGGGARSITSTDGGLTWSNLQNTNINSSFSTKITHLSNSSGNT